MAEAGRAACIGGASEQRAGMGARYSGGACRNMKYMQGRNVRRKAQKKKGKQGEKKRKKAIRE
jgi:hypothetical protein